MFFESQATTGTPKAFPRSSLVSGSTSTDGLVVVTGAAGFIGGHLARTLANRGRPVLAVDIAPCPDALRTPGIRFERLDLRDAAALLPLLRGADTVLHLASAHLQANAPEALFREVNVTAAAALVRAAAGAGVRRVVHASTVGVYGHVTSPPADEASPTAPVNRYERTKLEGEHAVRAAAAEAGIELAVLRPAWVYGPGCPRTAKLLRSVGSGRFFYVGNGDNLRHPVFIDDAVEAFIRAAAAPGAVDSRSFIIAGPRWMPLREIVDTAARVLGVPAPRRTVPRSMLVAAGAAAELAWGAARREPPFSRRSLAFFENDNAFQTAAAREAFGFVARTELEAGLQATVAERAAPERAQSEAAG